jgi:hypothetical protein
MRDINNAIKDFEKRDRKAILRKAAAPIRKTARGLAPVRSARGTRSKIGLRPNPRYSSGKKVAVYHPKNLQRSIKTLSFGRSEDVFIGPQFSKKKAQEYGKTGQPVDAYYAAMIFGSAAAFGRRVLKPALAQNRATVLNIVKREAKSKIINRILSRRGL